MQQFQTNVFGVLNVTNAVLPHMRERRSGTVVIVGSRTGWHAAVPVSLPIIVRHLEMASDRVCFPYLPLACWILRGFKSCGAWSVLPFGHHLSQT